jgi:hypothetical protein
VVHQQIPTSVICRDVAVCVRKYSDQHRLAPDIARLKKMLDPLLEIEQRPDEQATISPSGKMIIDQFVHAGTVQVSEDPRISR